MSHYAAQREQEQTERRVSVEHTGGPSSYYIAALKDFIVNVKTQRVEIQCEDVIEELGLTFSEANVFKAIWRRATARQGKLKKGNNPKYDAEKIVHYSQRILKQESND